MYKIDLKEFRRVNKMTQQDLAEYLGITQSYVANMEKGRDAIPDKYIRKILEDSSVDSTMLVVEDDDVVISRKVFDRISQLIDTVCSQQGTIAAQQQVVAEQHRTIDLLLSNRQDKTNRIGTIKGTDTTEIGSK